MSVTETGLLGVVSSALIAVGVAASMALLLGSEEGAARRAYLKYQSVLEADLRFVRVERRATSVIGAQCVVLGGMLVATLITNYWLWFAPAPFVLLAPQYWLQHERNRRVTAIDAQSATFLLALSNALRATPSLGEALETTSRLLPAPLCQELVLMLKEYELGTPLDQALSKLAARIGSKTVRSAVGTLRVARRTGGDLSQTLETSAASLREMARLEGVLRAKTAEAKAQTLLIAILPIPLVGLLQSVSPELIGPLGQTATGHLIVLVAVVLWLVAVVLARRILAVEL